MPHRSKRRALLLARPRPGRSEADVRASLTELALLLEGLGIEAADTLFIRRGAPSRAVLGEGKREEVSARLEELGCDRVVVDDSLDPGQHRELERALDVPVMDRGIVILRIFETRARTRLAKVEIELARLSYEAPRVREAYADDDRQGGGGRGARGHTNVELEKQAIRERMAKLDRELSALRDVRATQSARRRGAPRVSLVGYTNAGKSSLLEALTGSEVLVQDALFATLDPTVRALPTTPRILVSDTVGFIRNLPHALVRSFHSTLDEAREADLLLIVADASDPDFRDQLEVTRETLDAIGATAPARIVLNKIDRLDDAAREALAREHPDALFVSAHEPADVDRLRESLVRFFEREHEHDVLRVPFSEAALLAEIKAEARVMEEQYDGEGAILTVRAPRNALARWREALPAEVIESPAALLAAARAYGLPLRSTRDGFDSSGIEFRVVHAEDEEGTAWILRTPRRASAVQSAQREARVLRLVRDALPVRVPDWRLHAQDVIAYPRLVGTLGWSIGDDGEVAWALDAESVSEAFLRSFAETLAALQAIPLERAREAGVPIESVDEARADVARAMNATREALSVPEPLWARWQRWLEDDSMWPPRTALVHGDLHPGHLILDPEERITGIIDWTEGRVSDPSLDLQLFVGCFGREALDAVLVHYERAGGVMWPRVVEHTLERWAAYAAFVADWGLKTGSEEAMEHARQHLATIAAEAS